MYEGTKNTAYLDRLVNHFDVVLSNRDDNLTPPVVDWYRGCVMPAWSNDLYTDHNYAWGVHAGMLTAPIARFVYQVKKTPSLYPDYLDKALELCDIAIMVNAKFADAHNLRGIILEEMELYRKAAKSYQKAIKLDPEFEEAKKNLHDLQSKLGDDHNLVTVASFNSPGEAHLMKSFLESSGIPAFVDETSWISSIGFGGPKLLVAEPYVQQALAMVKDYDAASVSHLLSDTDEYFCTTCGKDVADEWEACPYCGDSLTDNPEAKSGIE